MCQNCSGGGNPSPNPALAHAGQQFNLVNRPSMPRNVARPNQTR